MTKPLYVKQFARDFPLMQIEAWSKGESTDPRQWTTEKQPKKPYILFENAGETINCYMDPEGIEWVKEKLLEKVKKDKNFIKLISETFDKKVKNVMPLAKKEKALPLSKLKKYYHELNSAWPWFEAAWWIMENPKEKLKGLDIKSIVKTRIDAGDISVSSEAVIRKSIEKAYPKLKKYRDVLLAEEVFSGKIPSTSVLDKRLKKYYYANNTLFTDKSLEDIEKMFNIQIEILEVNKKVYEIKGQVAYSGKITGKVRRVMNKNQASSFKKGEILVTSMTTPDLISIMREASAFVTDEGGITCHAAIMAREFKKPCIIGTKIATKILKDGDYVEVDANTGIVRILESSANNLPVNPDDYKFAGLWRDDLFAAYFWSRWFDPIKTKDLGFNELTFGGALTLNGGNFFWNKEMRKNDKAILDRAVRAKNASIFRNFRKVAEKTFIRVMKETEELSRLNPNADNLNTFIRLGRELMYFWTFGAVTADYVSEYIISFSQKEGIPAEEVSQYIVTPETELIKQQRDVRELYTLLKNKNWLSRIKDDKENLIKDIQKDNNLKKRFDDHLEKYGWIEMLNYIGNKLSIDRLLTLIEGYNPKKMEDHKKKKVSDEFQLILDIAECVAYARQAGAEYSSIFSYKLLDYLGSLAKKLGVSYREMLSLTPDEIIAFLKSGKNPKDLINKRSGYNWLIFSDKNEKVHVIDDRELLKKLELKMVPQAQAGKNAITGQIGNKGKVQGTVRVIIGADDFHKMKDGDILVTTMTTPDFVVLMQKSSGIITDIGGLLSHASIVSRELDKPCIIGTKFATKVLKDGDVVEVDANKGVVRILK